jgi:hypothetical protein
VHGGHPPNEPIPKGARGQHWIGRFLLAGFLSLGGFISGTAALLALAALALALGFDLSSGFVADPTVAALATAGSVGLGLLASAVVSPRAFPAARHYSLTRRLAAGILGVVLGSVLVRCGQGLGLRVDALSYDSSTAALGEEGVLLLLFYGGTPAVAFLALGRRPSQRAAS